MAERKLSPERVQRRDNIKERILAAYRYGKLKVVFTVQELMSPAHYGESRAEGNPPLVLINPRSGNLVKVVETLVHEAIHCLEPGWHHNRVYAVEQDVMSVLTMNEKQHLLHWAADNGYWRDC